MESRSTGLAGLIDECRINEVEDTLGKCKSLLIPDRMCFSLPLLASSSLRNLDTRTVSTFVK